MGSFPGLLLLLSAQLPGHFFFFFLVLYAIGISVVTLLWLYCKGLYAVLYVNVLYWLFLYVGDSADVTQLCMFNYCPFTASYSFCCIVS